jgi:hypothetical protein
MQIPTLCELHNAGKYVVRTLYKDCIIATCEHTKLIEKIKKDNYSKNRQNTQKRWPSVCVDIKNLAEISVTLYRSVRHQQNSSLSHHIFFMNSERVIRSKSIKIFLK